MNAQRSLFQDNTPTFDEIMSAWNGDREWLSRSEIARALGRSKSPILIAVINVLVNVGYLTVKNEPLPNGADYFKYSPTAKWYEDGGVY